jgi:VanZ family protein
MCLAIFIESSITSAIYPRIEFELSDKVVHIIIYFALFLTAYYSFNNQKRNILIKEYSLISSFIFTSLYGASDELHQYFVPGRTCDFFDWVANVVGAFLAIYAIIIYRRLSKNKTNKLVKNAI